MSTTNIAGVLFSSASIKMSSTLLNFLANSTFLAFTLERFKINDEFLKYRRKVRKIENLKKYFIDNILAIITIIIALLDLILTIVALSK